MKTVKLSEARNTFSAIADAVHHYGERFMVTKGASSKQFVGIVSAEDLRLLQALEDRHDIDIAELRLATEKPVDFEEAMKEGG